MNDLLNAVFGLGGSDLGFGAPDARVGFERPLPAWLWAMLAGSAALLAWWSYRRLVGPRGVRVALAAARAAVLFLLVVVLAGPQLTRQQTRTEQDYAVMLVDRSASLGVPDVVLSSGAAETREEQLRRALSGAAPALAEVARSKRLLWLGFDAGAYELPGAANPATPAAPLPALSDPQGRRTSLTRALEDALQRVAARPVSAVVIASDGRTLDGGVPRRLLRRLQSEQIPVHVLPLGSPEPLLDLAVRRVEAPEVAFVDDTVPVTVEIARTGPEPEGSPGVLRLLDTATGRVLDELAVPPFDGRESQTVGLKTSPPEAGEPRWTVVLEPATPDLTTENNRAELDVRLVDRPVRVVYFDGYPRWERRYLTSLLLREGSVESSSLLLAAQRRYIQEGDVDLQALPSSPEEWAPFDVVILGDLRPDLFGREQLEQLREHVAVRGAGLIWIAGPGATPGAWAGTPLADLLPITLSGGSGGAAGPSRWPAPVVLQRTPLAERLGLIPENLPGPEAGWTLLRWAQRIDPDRVKPAAEVYAVAVPAEGGAEPAPLVLGMRYGAGRVAYVATDEIWRWRYGRGETLNEQFWLPLVRLLGRESLARSERPAILRVLPERALVEQPVQVTVELLDQALIEAGPRSVAAVIEQAGAGESVAARLELGPGDGEGGSGPRNFGATWIPTEPGTFTVRVEDPNLGLSGLAEEVRVALPDDELAHPESDHATLIDLAAETGGRVLSPGDLTNLPEALPNRELVIAGPVETERLWDTPLTLVVLLLLLTFEWIGRKLIRLA